MSKTVSRRALHWVFKIGDRKANLDFFRQVLGMKVLRHEEFEEGCKATCNGPYDGKWSKTMIGYGPEDNHFVVELTYNYGIGSYNFTNDYLGLHINSTSIYEKVKNSGYNIKNVDDRTLRVDAPDGYPFYIKNENQAAQEDPITKLTLSSTNLVETENYWTKILKLNVLNKTNDTIQVQTNEGKSFSIEFKKVTALDHGTAFGRIAFSVPAEDVKKTEALATEHKYKILTPFTELETPGKATVTVVIFSDPDGYEICFVNENAFKELSKVDYESEKTLDEAIENDNSAEYYKKKGKSKPSA